jgi:hypothetical protein
MGSQPLLNVIIEWAGLASIAVFTVGTASVLVFYFFRSPPWRPQKAFRMARDCPGGRNKPQRFILFARLFFDPDLDQADVWIRP